MQYALYSHEDPFDLSQDEEFTQISRYKQRLLEREGHRQLAEINGAMREPVTEADLMSSDVIVCLP